MKKQIIISICLIVLVLAVLGVCIAKNSSENGTTSSTTTAPNPEGPTKLRYTTNNVFGYFDTITVIDGYAETGEEFDAIVQDILTELGEYHKLFDIYNSYSGINNIRTINRLFDGEHKVVTVDQRIIDMLLYAKKMYNVTGGQMNIAMGSVLSIWHDYRSEAEDNYYIGELPPMEELQEAAQHTDINNLIIDEENCTVYISDPKMTLDVGAIAKGYAVEMIAQMLEKRGITGYIINVGGNVRTVGAKANGGKWVSAIENPLDEEGSYLAYLGLAGEAIVTSGSYQRYYYVDGKAYHHIIDKETLMPAEYFVSVSVVCKNSADGDGLSTALFCMSLEEGMALVESLEGVEAHWVLPDGTRYKSSGFADFEVEYNPK